MGIECPRRWPRWAGVVEDPAAGSQCMLLMPSRARAQRLGIAEERLRWTHRAVSAGANGRFRQAWLAICPALPAVGASRVKTVLDTLPTASGKHTAEYDARAVKPKVQQQFERQIQPRYVQNNCSSHSVLQRTWVNHNDLVASKANEIRWSTAAPGTGYRASVPTPTNSAAEIRCNTFAMAGAGPMTTADAPQADIGVWHRPSIVVGVAQPGRRPDRRPAGCQRPSFGDDRYAAESD